MKFDERTRTNLFRTAIVFAIVGTAYYVFVAAKAVFDLFEEHPYKSTVLFSLLSVIGARVYYCVKNKIPFIPDELPTFFKTKVDHTTANNLVDKNLSNSFQDQALPELCDAKVIPILGGKGVGKKSLLNLIDKNSELKSLLTSSGHKLMKEYPLSSMLEKNKVMLHKYSESLISIMITNKDLTDYEMQFIKKYAENDHEVLLVLNKIDVMSKKEREELILEINNKIKPFNGKVTLIETSADPAPQIRIRESADGTQKEETYKVDPDIKTFYSVLTEKIKKQNNLKKTA
ncbi:MAG: hypothetical protein OHK0056_25060 [Bacteriovoracaceae bacterium]